MERICNESRLGRYLNLLKGGKRPRRIQVLMIALVIAGLLFAVAPVSAGSYSFDGVPLTDATHGTIKGKVFIDKGSKYGLQSPPYLTTFSVPSGDSVKWARIYIGVWGGTENNIGWANGTITNISDTYTLTPSYLSKTAPSSNVVGAGNGKWIASHDVTQYINLGQTFTANITTAGTIDGRIYDVTLVAVIADSGSNKTAYWINYGNVNERYDAGGGFGELNNNVTTFGAPSYNASEAKLYVGQIVGTSGESDFGFFNAPNIWNSPRNLSHMRWEREDYRKYQLGTDDDLADSNSDGTSTSYFDLDTFIQSNSTQLKDLVNLRGDNELVFWRGHDYNHNGVIEGTWGSSSYEGETYVSPFLAALVLKDISRLYDFNSNTLGTPGTDLWAYNGSVTARPPGSNDVPSTDMSTDGALKADDTVYNSNQTTVSGTYAAQRFVFTLQSPDTTTSNIAKLTISWNGKGTRSSGNHGERLYIWDNSGSGSYLELANTASGGDTTLSGDVTTNIGNYISSNRVTALVVQNAPNDGLGNVSKIYTDYVKLVVDPAV